jgi:predicted peptidase
MDYDDDKSYPLVLALHYSGHGLPFYGEIFLTDFIEPALKSLEAIIVAPDCPTKDWTMPESEEYIKDLLTYLGEIYQYESNKVVIVGYSMGGMGVWYLTEHMLNHFTCGVIISAKPPDVVSESAGSVPLYIIHGRDDALFPVIDTNRAVLELESQDRVVTYRIIERATHFETHKFVPALQDAVPWIVKQWEMAGRKKG